MSAACFIILALSGLNITFGKPLLLPLIGPGAVSEWSEFAKYAHDYLSFPFSGYVLMFPFYGTDIHSMQIAEVVHAIVAVLFVAAMLGHIYIGTIGMEGAFEAMGSGTVDVNWAKEHHSLWVEEEMARTGPNERQRQPAGTPAE